MIERHLEAWSLDDIDVLFIENVGNLVCPSSYDLGEEAKIVLLSVTEGEDKPLKYPSIFHKSALLILTKVDLLPYVPFDMEAAKANARQVNPDIEILEVACSTGKGMEAWRAWLDERRAKRHALASSSKK
jgi:hydrogenase nickel incorporation protein HypB